MIILTIRTDKPEAELGLYDNHEQLIYETWQAHRKLAETIHLKLQSVLESHQKSFDDLHGIVAYAGPGSFTGLRIGLSVANALSDGLQIPIIGCQEPDWLQKGITRLLEGGNDKRVLPEYGAPVHITRPKH